jgi:hypothetical protein
MGAEAMASPGYQSESDPPTMPATLEMEVHERTAPAGWDEDVLAAGGVVFHSEAWARYKVKESGGEPLFCLWREREGGRVVGRALAIRKPSRGSRAARLATKLAFDSPPAGSDPGTDFIAPLRDWARHSPALVEVGLGSFDALGPWGPEALPNPRQRVEFVMPSGDADAVWEAMRQLARRKVKKARKSEFEISRLVTAAELAPFTEVYELTQARLERNKGYVAGFELDRESFAAALAELTTRDRGRLYAASRGGRLEAAVFIATFGDRAYMVYSSATDEGRDLGAPFLVLFEALHELREDGFAVLNLGGAAGDAADPSSSEHGLHQFKTRFGAAVVPHTSGVLVPRPARARLVRSVRRLVRL